MLSQRKYFGMSQQEKSTLLHSMVFVVCFLSVIVVPLCFFSALYVRPPAGVHSLALLLMELQPSADGPQILAADALYQLGRVEEAYRLLLSVGPTNPRAPILARLALLQLHRGFLYDTNQVYKFEVPIFHV